VKVEKWNYISHTKNKSRSSLILPTSYLQNGVTLLYNDATYVLVNTPEKLDKLIEAMQTAKVRAIDVETSGLSVLEDFITGISVSWQEGTGYYIPIGHTLGVNLPREETIEKLRPSFEDTKITNIAHGKKFDGAMLAALNFDVEWAKTNPDYATDLWLTAYSKELGIESDLHNDAASCFKRCGLEVTFQYDTMIMAYLTGSYTRIGTGRSTASLKKIVKLELGIDMVFIEELFRVASGAKKKVRIEFEKLDPDEAIPLREDLGSLKKGTVVKPYEYACADSDMTLRLFNRILPRVKDLFLLKVDLGVLPMTKLMELNGIYANVEKMNATYKRLTNEAAKVKALVFRDVGEALGSVVDFDLGSPTQVGKVLFEELKYPVIERSEKTGKALTNAKVLDVMGKDFPLVANILTWRSLRKNAEDFFKGMQDYISSVDSRIHCSYATAHVNGGRFASENPNMQNQPRLTEWKVFDKELPDEEGTKRSPEGYKCYEIKSNLRRCYEAIPDYYMLEGDYSQIEYRVFAGRSQARALLNAYRDNADLHTRNASMIFGIPESEVTKALRTEAKTYSFGIMYGMGANGIALRTGRSKEECQRLYNRYFEAIPEGKQHIQDVIDTARRNGFVTTHFGRKVVIPELSSPIRSVRFRGEREAFNGTIQGCQKFDTRIVTLEDGLVSIGDLVTRYRGPVDGLQEGQGVTATVWNGEAYVPCQVVYSGKKQLVNVTFQDGSVTGVSPQHKFLREDTQRNQHWRESKDLVDTTTNNPDRVCLTQPVRNHPSGGFTDTQEMFSELVRGTASNSNNYDANDVFSKLTPFEFGCLLGRLSTDGSVEEREDGGSCVVWLVAEHELPVLSYLKGILDKLGWSYTEKERPLRAGRTQRLYQLSVFSKSLVTQLKVAQVKHHVPPQVSCNIEALRGYLRGFVDGDGGVVNKQVVVTFGRNEKDDFEDKQEWAQEIQAALKVFGLSTYLKVWERSIRVHVSSCYNKNFLQEIGFINPEKTEKLKLYVEKSKPARHVIGVKRIEITDQFVPMFDVVNVPGEQYMMNGLITHNTAADILRIGMNRLTKKLIAQYGPRFNDKVKPVLTTHDSLAFMVHRSIHPDAVIKLIEEACEVEIKDFPHIAMEFAVGKNYGEMVDWEKLRSTFDPNDVNLGVGSDTVTLDENIEYMEEHPEGKREISSAGFRHVADVLPVSSSIEDFEAPVVPSVITKEETVVTEETPVEVQSYSIVLNEELTMPQATELKDLLVRHPGKNTITLLWDGGEIPMIGFPTSLGKQEEALFQSIFRCHLVQTTVSLRALTMGIKL